MLDLSTKTQKAVFGVLFALIAFFLFFPVYWLIVTSLQSDAKLYSGELHLLPLDISIDQFRKAFQNPDIWVYMWNSILTATVSAVLTTLLASYAGYSFAKYSYRGRKLVMLIMIAAQMFPFAMLLISIYYMLLSWGLLDTHFGLILSYLVFSLPAGVYLLYTFFERVPSGLIEAARVDGASELTIIHRIIFPISGPAMLSVGLYAFIWAWNDLLFALTILRSDELRTLGPGILISYTGEHSDDWGGLMAASLLVSLPVIVAFSYLQKYFVQGLTAGAVK